MASILLEWAGSLNGLEWRFSIGMPAALNGDAGRIDCRSVVDRE
jgi:hypothetical protein